MQRVELVDAPLGYSFVHSGLFIGEVRLRWRLILPLGLVFWIAQLLLSKADRVYLYDAVFTDARVTSGTYCHSDRVVGISDLAGYRPTVAFRDFNLNASRFVFSSNPSSVWGL